MVGDGVRAEAALEHAQDPVADREPRGAGADGGHDARAFAAHRGAGVRVHPERDQHVTEVEAGRPDAEQDLTRFQCVGLRERGRGQQGEVVERSGPVGIEAPGAGRRGQGAGLAGAGQARDVHLSVAQGEVGFAEGEGGAGRRRGQGAGGGSGVPVDEDALAGVFALEGADEADDRGGGESRGRVRRGRWRARRG
ncbi:putative protein OS=Streptomyces fumanus OX=67302 GN=GCM10018772_62450 PE=4 SV=1 [Streptomyces fumanus]